MSVRGAPGSALALESGGEMFASTPCAMLRMLACVAVSERPRGFFRLVIRLVTPCPYSISVSSWFCTSSKSCNVKGFGGFWQDGGSGGGL